MLRKESFRGVQGTEIRIQRIKKLKGYFELELHTDTHTGPYLSASPLYSRT